MKNGIRILAVDDNQHILEYIKRVLEEEGYSVITVDNGNSALAKFVECKPDLVLLDIRMAEVNGYQILERIRAMSDVPVLMVTAVRKENSIKSTLSLGADDYIIKPFPPQVLLARIQAKLRRVKPGTSFYTAPGTASR